MYLSPRLSPEPDRKALLMWFIVTAVRFGLTFERKNLLNVLSLVLLLADPSAFVADVSSFFTAGSTLLSILGGAGGGGGGALGASCTEEKSAVWFISSLKQQVGTLFYNANTTLFYNRFPGALLYHLWCEKYD